jgi:hypothetical protein
MYSEGELSCRKGRVTVLLEAAGAIFNPRLIPPHLARFAKDEAGLLDFFERMTVQQFEDALARLASDAGLVQGVHELSPGLPMTRRAGVTARPIVDEASDGWCRPRPLIASDRCAR